MQATPYVWNAIQMNGAWMFSVTIRNAVEYLDDKLRQDGKTDDDAIIFRMVTGSTPDPTMLMENDLTMGGHVTVRVVEMLTQNLASDSRVKVSIGAYRDGANWNHGKIIAVDGRYMISGGHNYYTTDYLVDDPVHDISVVYEGSVALSGL